MTPASQAQLLADLLYAQFNTPVSITAGRGTILAFSDQPPSLIDPPRRDGILFSQPPTIPDWLTPYIESGRELIRAPGNEKLQTLPRTILVVSHRGYPVGYVFALDPEQKIPSDWHIHNKDLLTAVGLEIELLKSRSSQIQMAVRSLLSQSPGIRQTGVEALSSMRSFETSNRIRVIVTELQHETPRVFAQIWDGHSGLDGAWAEIDGRLIQIVSEDSHPASEAIKRFRSTLVRIDSAPRAFHGIGGEVSGLELARQAYEEALGALRVAKILEPGSSIGDWNHLGSWRSLVALGRERGLHTVDPRINRMVGLEPDENITLLREYLERNGEVDKIASEMHLHRSTVYSRLKRLETKYELKLNDAEDRLTIIFGLRLTQLYA